MSIPRHETIYQVNYFTSGEQWNSSLHRTLEGAREHLTFAGYVPSGLNERNLALGLDELWIGLKDKTQTGIIVTRVLGK